MRPKRVAETLQTRVQWLGLKLERHNNPEHPSYHMMTREKEAMQYALDLVRKEIEFQMRKRLEDERYERNDDYFREFYSQNQQQLGCS